MNTKKKRDFGGHLRWDRAQRYINSYKNSSSTLIKKHLGANPPDLLNFEFPAADIIPLINDPNVAAVYLAFGYHELVEPIGYTLIALGIDYEDNLLKDVTNFVYDSALQRMGTMADAIVAIQYYKSHNPGIPIRVGHQNKLNGFWFSTSEFKTLIRQGAVKINFDLAYHPAPTMHNESEGYTLVMYGIDSGNLPMTSDADEIFDYAHPCPNSCPRGLI